MIIDFHTHIFPIVMNVERDRFARIDPTFAEMYVDPSAKMASPGDLLGSMRESDVDMSVALGFAWWDHEHIRHQNDYILQAAERSNGRIIPFATVNMDDPRSEREIELCAERGARGLGELRPESQGWDLNGPVGARLADIARRLNLILLFHVTEEGERTYAGRHGLRLESFRAFCETHGDLSVVGAHVGGGYYWQKRLRAAPYVDTAAAPFLHPGDEAIDALKPVPGHRILFGSDFPLVPQSRALAELRRACPRDSIEGALGENARELLDI